MEKIAEGTSSEIYELTNSTVVKLFKDNYQDIILEKEFNNNLLICKTGIHTAQVISKINLEGREGIVFEKLNGITMAMLLKKKPWLIIYYAKRFAETHVAIHQCLCPGLPSQKNALKQFIYLKNLSKDAEDRLLDILNKLPDGENICHNDFNLDNVVLFHNRYYTIDWFCATNGDPAMDIAHTLINLKRLIKGSRYSLARLIKQIYFYIFAIIYLRHSMGLSGVPRQSINMWERFLLSIDIHRWEEPLDSNRILSMRDE